MVRRCGPREDQGLRGISDENAQQKIGDAPRSDDGDRGRRGRDDPAGDGGRSCVLCSRGGGVLSLAVLVLGDEDLSEWCETGRRLKECMTGGSRQTREQG